MPKYGALPPETIDAIRRLRTQRHTQQAIATELNVCVSTVARYTRDLPTTQPPAVTAEQRAEIRERYAQGEARASIAHALGITISAVDRYAAGLPRRQPRTSPTPTPETIQAMRKLRREGHSAVTIARLLGTTRGIAQHHTQDIVGHTPRLPRSYPPITPEMDRDIRLRYARGQGVTIIARELAIPLNAVTPRVAALPNHIKRLTPETREQIKALYTQHHSTSHIADKLNLPRPTVWYYNPVQVAARQREKAARTPPRPATPKVRE
jgi:DNA invertase Pin-like site-specific DNA recombinase